MTFKKKKQRNNETCFPLESERERESVRIKVSKRERERKKERQFVRPCKRENSETLVSILRRIDAIDLDVRFTVSRCDFIPSSCCSKQKQYWGTT